MAFLKLFAVLCFVSIATSHPLLGDHFCGKGVACNSDETCCQLPKEEANKWACCPVSHATCCSDGHQCCPSGYTCDDKIGQCNKAAASTKMILTSLRSDPAVHQESTQSLDITCPDGQNTCSSNATCCLQNSGLYGCCPLANAECCSDGEHCCPSGYYCKAQTNECEKRGSPSVPMLRKIESMPVKVAPVPVTVPRNLSKDVTCPNNKAECPSGSTCCLQSNDEYSCCPVEDATCCSDKKHCCPRGYECKPDDGECVKPNKTPSSTQWLRKQPAMLRDNLSDVDDVYCPDGKHYCDSGNTCCTAKDGYDCCPLENAVCCKDDQHCCPYGSICDDASGKCQSAIEETIESIPIMTIGDSIERVICRNNKVSCDYTCCRDVFKTNSYLCCPHYEGVCCSNANFCCMSNQKCSVSNGKTTCINKVDGQTTQAAALTLLDYIQQAAQPGQL